MTDPQNLLDTAERMVEALERDAKQGGEIPRHQLRLKEVRQLLNKIQNQGGVKGNPNDMTDTTLIKELARRLLDKSEVYID